MGSWAGYGLVVPSTPDGTRLERVELVRLVLYLTDGHFAGISLIQERCNPVLMFFSCM